MKNIWYGSHCFFDVSRWFANPKLLQRKVLQTIWSCRHWLELCVFLVWMLNVLIVQNLKNVNIELNFLSIISLLTFCNVSNSIFYSNWLELLHLYRNHKGGNSQNFLRKFVIFFLILKCFYVVVFHRK